MTAMTTGYLLLGLLLDRRFGDPERLWSRLPHPVEMFGQLITIADRRLNDGANRKAAGIAFMLLACGALFAIGWFAARLPFGGVLEILAAFVLLAQKSLVDHVSAVAQALRIGLAHGRRAVSQIVGRDAVELDPGEVARAAVESAAEGFADGVVAPAFWFAVFGLPGIIVYKFANTADSMIGYRNDRYSEFGWAAARLDDALNWIPARIAGVLVLLAHGSLDRFWHAVSDAKLHDSPNAGWPESAMAHALGIALGGPRTYDGRAVDLPFMNSSGRREIEPADIDNAVRSVRGTHKLLMFCLLGLFIFQIAL